MDDENPPMCERIQGDSVWVKVCSDAMPMQAEEPSCYNCISVASVVEDNLGAGVREASKECGTYLRHKDDWWPSWLSSAQVSKPSLLSMWITPKIMTGNFGVVRWLVTEHHAGFVDSYTKVPSFSITLCPVSTPRTLLPSVKPVLERHFIKPVIKAMMYKHVSVARMECRNCLSFLHIKRQHRCRRMWRHYIPPVL